MDAQVAYGNIEDDLDHDKRLADMFSSAYECIWSVDFYASIKKISIEKIRESRPSDFVYEIDRAETREAYAHLDKATFLRIGFVFSYMKGQPKAVMRAKNYLWMRNTRADAVALLVILACEHAHSRTQEEKRCRSDEETTGPNKSQRVE